MGFSERPHGLSTLDRAHAHRLAGEDAEALRLGVACALAAPTGPGPASLLTRMLVDADRPGRVAELVPRLVAAFVRRGDLPQAVVAAQIIADAGGDVEAPLSQIAEAFGAGSDRVGDGHAVPPPFPEVPPLDEALAKLDLEGLYARAEQQLGVYLEGEDDVVEQATLPLLPLFGALAPGVLRQLLVAARVDEVSADTDVVRQGDPGVETFVIARGLLKVVRTEGADETTLAELGPGAVFGEMALVSSAPRSASVIAAEPAQVLVFAREELERLAPSAPSLGEHLARFCRARMENNLIRNARILRGVPTAKRAQLLGRFGSRFFEAGETLIAANTQANHVFLIASGSVSVSIPDGDDRLILATLGAGDTVGEVSMILRRPTGADARAIYPTIALDLSRETLHEVMRESPGLLVELYDLAARRDEEATHLRDSPHEDAEAHELIMV